ncbi:MAG: class I SAM-dependent methyltransferase [Chloroflexi bacterium]|nr:class I SAM-dependent methyltransferase [Chloroflexota bacterium]
MIVIVALIVGAALLIVALAWWLLIKSEGVYLGRGVVIWLYDVYARRYDNIKQYDPYGEEHYLARPVLKRLLPVTAPLVLDVATGTGRLPLALLEQPNFQGRVIGVDLSRRMLTVAAEKLTPHRDRAVLMHVPAEKLPFPDNTFDLVTCLEALEFMMDQWAVLREMARVLRPGGLMVLTNRQGRDVRYMPGHIISHPEFERRLRQEIGLSHVYIQPWQIDYRLVWGIKIGQSRPTGPRLLPEVWRCATCGEMQMIESTAGSENGSGAWRCAACGARIMTGADGVIEGLRAT